MKTLQKNTQLPISIGSDPEFLLYTKNKEFAPAYETIKKLIFNDNSNNVVPIQIENKGEYGWDGANRTGEIRPKPSNDIETATDNLKQIITKMHQDLPNLTPTTLSINMPIGGHIHLDRILTEKEKKLEKSSYNFDSSNTRTKQITTNIAAFLIPIVASEHALSGYNRSINSSYGKLNDMRTDIRGREHKNVVHEIRGLSAEWLTTERTAKATFAYLTCVWNEINKETDTITKSNITIKTPKQLQRIQELVTLKDPIVLQGYTKLIKKEIKNFELYQQFKEEIDFILSPEKVKKEKEQNDYNIFKGWGLIKNTPTNIKTKTITKEQLLKKITSKEIQNKNEIENIGNQINILENGDYKTSQFAEKLYETTVLNDINLKNRYFIFGLKKETKGYLIKNISEKTFREIPQNKTKEQIKNITEAMTLKVASNHRNYKTINTLNPLNGKVETDQKSLVIIGIPYETRLKENYKEFLLKIYKTEKNKQPKINIETVSYKEPPIEKIEQNNIAQKNILITEKVSEIPINNEDFETILANTKNEFTTRNIKEIEENE